MHETKDQPLEDIQVIPLSEKNTLKDIQFQDESEDYDRLQSKDMVNNSQQSEEETQEEELKVDTKFLIKEEEEEEAYALEQEEFDQNKV